MNPDCNVKKVASSRLYLSIVLPLIVLLLSCNDESQKDSKANLPESYLYSIPVQKNDGWQVASLSDEAQTHFVALMDSIYKENNGYRFIDSILVIKGNKLVFDEVIRTELDIADTWANNTDVDLHILNSVTKSFVSALVGIAIDQNYIEGVDVKVHDYFSHKQPVANWSEEKANITLKNWLE